MTKILSKHENVPDVIAGMLDPEPRSLCHLGSRVSFQEGSAVNTARPGEYPVEVDEFRAI